MNVEIEFISDPRTRHAEYVRLTEWPEIDKAEIILINAKTAGNVTDVPAM